MTATSPQESLREPYFQDVTDAGATLRIMPPRIQTRPVLNAAERAQFAVIVSCWLVASFFFWQWWFQIEHVAGWPQYIVTTAAIMYDLAAMPLVFIFMVWKMKKPEPRKAAPGLRVAMVTAIVPASESIEVLERTLVAMSAVRYPHDNWVLDEGGDPRVRELCERHGAHYWSRKGIPEFNQPHWPHQAKTKSGNYNSWFVDVAYDRYDYLVQLDTDHAPVESYLDKVLGYFDDPDVAYVALPSVYWNLDDWPSRGSSEQSQIFQGPIQMGYYGWADAPMIIGSHAAYRVKHLRDIGGFAPSRAEDHLDTLRFAKQGYRGVFVPENLATGLGPHTLSDYMVQEHQWAFSIAQVLMLHTRGIGRMALRQRLVFLFSELWYSIFALTYLLLYALPLYALITNKPVVSVAFVDFLKFSTPVAGIALLAVAWGYSKGWYRPGTHFFLSWQGILLTVARWPIVLIALINAVVSVALRGGAFSYMVTPKGARGISARDTLRNSIPYIVLAVIPVVVVFVYPMVAGAANQPSAGYILFALLSAASFTLLVVAGIADHIKTNLKTRAGWRRSVAGTYPLLAILAILTSGLTLGGMTNASSVQAALTHRPTASIAVAQSADPLLSEHQTGERGIATGFSLPPDEGAGHALPGVSVVAVTPTPEPIDEPTPALVSAVVDSWLFDLDREGVTFGAFDPTGELSSVSGLEHIFAEWSRDETGGIPLKRVEASYRRGVPVMLSYEPWPLEGHSQWTVLSNTASGDYDDVIRSAARALATIESPILVRFGHEMDIDLLYPWAGRDPEKYIAAYRRVVTIFHEEGATNVLWVWSPGGMLDAHRYYPGDSFVDYVGVTVLEYTIWERDAGYPTPRPIKKLVNEKYRLFMEIGKPMIIAELGMDLDEDLKSAALTNIIASLPYFPQLRAIVYFNDQNPVTPVMSDRPLWRLNEGQRELLVNALAGSSWIEPPPGSERMSVPDSKTDSGISR